MSSLPPPMTRPQRHAFDQACEHLRAGRLAEAERGFTRLLAAAPKLGAAHNMLGIIARRTGHAAEALAHFRAACAANPGDAAAFANLGNALREAGQADEAMAACLHAVEINAEMPEAWVNVGLLMLGRGEAAQAAACFRRALAMAPGLPQAHHNLGMALAAQGRPDLALASYQRALTIAPEYADAATNLGVTLTRLGRPAEAEAPLRHVAERYPGSAEAWINLGLVLQMLRRTAEAVTTFRRAVEARPEEADTHFNLGAALTDAGQAEAALAATEQALALTPGHWSAWSNRLLLEAILQRTPPEDMRALASEFGVLATGAAHPFTAWTPATPGAPLKVGLVSGDLRTHPVGHFIEGVLAAADPARLAFHAFPTVPLHDELSARLRPHLAEWTPIDTLSDEQAAALIHDRGLDVLIDLSGHTRHNRLPLFAWRAAPVQVAWLGYFATTGLPAFDALIGDPQVTPSAEEGHFVEPIRRLPDAYYCFTPPTGAPDVAPLPSAGGSPITFGCLNNLIKLTDSVLATWAQVLAAVPESRLVLQAGQLDDPAAREALLARFAALGVAAGRLTLLGWTTREAYFATYHGIDIALDPFPYPGGTTSCEALWMGVPVLSLRGDRMLAHNGKTILTAAGLPDWIAADPADYVAKAASFAADRAALAALRARLREQVRTSPLCDAKRFAAALAGILEELRFG